MDLGSMGAVLSTVTSSGKKFLDHAIPTVLASLVAAGSATYVTSIRNEERLMALVKTQETISINQDKIASDMSNKFDRLEDKLEKLRADLYEPRSAGRGR